MSRTRAGTRRDADSSLGSALARAGLAAGFLALVRLGLCFVPPAPGMRGPARAGDVFFAFELVLAAAAAALVALFSCAATARSHVLLRVVAPSLACAALFAVLLGWPVQLPASMLPDAVVGRWIHALVAGGAALLATAIAVGSLVRSTSRPSRRLGLGALVGVASVATAWAVAHRARAELPRIEAEEVVFTLLDSGVTREVILENERGRVAVSSFAANRLTQLDSGTLPLLAMVPPAEVEIRIPPSAPDARLRMALGIAEDSYVSEGRTKVGLSAVFEGVEVLAAELTTWAGAAPQERTWRRAEVPVGAGGTLVLRATFDGPDGEAPRAGFGLLEVVRSVQVERTVASRRRPNAVLVVVDTLRADRLKSYGHTRPTSPALDRLAARGTLFETAFSAASWTWPSTTSILTSLSPPEHGVLDQTACYLSEELTTVAEVFQGAGFTTAAFVANPLVSADKNFDKGFQTFREYRWDSATRVVRDAKEWLREMGRYRFFLYVHIVDPHGPYEPDADLAERFGRPMPRGYSPSAQEALVDLLRASSEDVDLPRLERFSKYLSSLYDAEVATADRALGTLFEALGRLGLADRTVIAVTSDHGEEFLEHGMMGHGRQVFEESVRVPLILSGPGVPRGRRVTHPVENRFLAPTLLELCGVEPRENLARRPDLLAGPGDPGLARGPIFFGSDLGWWPGEGSRLLRAVLDGGEFLIWSPPREGQRDLFALYDLERDPGAANDLSDERPGDVVRLRKAISEWWESSSRIRPTVVGGDREVRSLLEELGYIGE